MCLSFGDYSADEAAEMKAYYARREAAYRKHVAVEAARAEAVEMSLRLDRVASQPTEPVWKHQAGCPKSDVVLTGPCYYCAEVPLGEVIRTAKWVFAST